MNEQEEVQRVVDAAWDVLRRTSYENLKIQAVIRTSGISVGTFYRHFTGKQDLLVALLRGELRRATEVLWGLTSTGTAEERVEAWVRAVVSLLFGHKAGPRARWFTTMPHEVRQQVADETPEAECDTAAPLVAAIAAGVADGTFPRAHPTTDAQLILSLCSRLSEGRDDFLGDDAEAAVATVAEFVLAALKNPKRGPVGP